VAVYFELKDLSIAEKDELLQKNQFELKGLAE